MRQYLCSTPPNECCGASTKTTKGLRYEIKTHATPEQAFRCHVAYLIRSGYVRVGSREFRDPVTGYHLVLTRPGKYGAPMRPGKSVKSMVGKRIVPKRRGSADRALGGTISG